MATGIDLGKQVGPLPLGAWVVVVGAGLGFAYYTSRANPAPVVVEDTSMDPGVGEGPGWVAVPPPTYGPTAPEATTNEEWGRNAINHLIAQGYNPSLADSAIRKYLAAEQLSVSEYALITEALRKLGAAPVPLPPGPGPQDPSTPTTPAKTTVQLGISGPDRVKRGRLYKVTVKLSGVSGGRVKLYRNGKVFAAPWVNGSREIARVAWWGGTDNGKLTYYAKYEGTATSQSVTSNTIIIQVVR